MNRNASLRPTESVAPVDDSWVLSEENVPESELHDEVLGLLRDVLVTWLVRTGLPGSVARNRALRWRQERPAIGVDPDVMLLDRKHPEGDLARSVLTWEPAHPKPRLAVEVVSENAPPKDYVDAPLKYAASGVTELWVYDPLRLARGRAIVLQGWRRAADGSFPRVYAGEGPAWSEELGAWFITTSAPRRLRIADDEAGTRVWPTEAEAEATKRKAEAAKRKAETRKRKAETRKREEAEAEIARLRALLAAKG